MIDIETLEHVQNTLIKTVNDVIQVQKEGMQKRAEATTRLRALQENLNQLVIGSVNSLVNKCILTMTSFNLREDLPDKEY